MKLVSVWIEEFKGEQGIDILKELYPGMEEVKRQRERYLRALETFRKLYGDKEAEVYSVPGRSEVCGNHTDHQRGEVLASAVSMDMLAVVSPQPGVVKLVSDGYDMEPVSLDELEKKQKEEGTSEGLVWGVLARCRELGYSIGGFEGFLTSEVMQGSGLSSSAAFEVMIGTIVSGLYNEMQIDPVVIAQIGQYSENMYFGKPSGLMDQSACSVGGLIHIDFSDAANPKVEKIEVDFSEFHHSLCIVDVHASHADLTPEYAAIPEQPQIRLEIAEAGTDAIITGKLEPCYEHFTPKLKSNLPLSSFRQILADAISPIGKFLCFDRNEWRQNSVFIYLKYEKLGLVVQFSFDDNEKIQGIWLRYYEC